MPPNEASRKEIENKVWRNLYPEFGRKTMTPKFSIGHHVRITKQKIALDQNTLNDGRKRFLQFLKFN